MSFLDLATISFHRRNEMETRINTFVSKCDLATNNIQKLKERVKGFVDHLNCEQSELKDRFLNCMQRLEEYTYLITDFNIACEQFEATSVTETEPVHDNLNTPAPPVSPNPNPNLIDILSETVQTTMTVCTAQCPTKVFNHVKVPKDQQKLIQFSSTSCSSEGVPEVKVEQTVECDENTGPVAAHETATGDVMDVASVTTTGDVTFAMNETTNDDVTGAGTINDDMAVATNETVTTEGTICRQFELHNLPVQPMLRTDIHYDATIMNIDGATFWMLVGDPNELYKLMTQMTQHYQCDENLVQLSPAEAASLTYCAYHDHDETASYYRALLVKCVDEGRAEVFLVDTGECRTAEICHLQPLAAQFCEQPPYVYCCHLTAVDMFYSNDPNLASRQEEVLNEYIGVQCVIQVDDNNSESLGIWVTIPAHFTLNDFLVQEKLAVYTDKEMAPDRQSPARARAQTVAQAGTVKSDSDSFTVVLGPPGLVHGPPSGSFQAQSPPGHSVAGPSGVSPRSPPGLNRGGPCEPSQAGRPPRQDPSPELSREAFRFNQSAPGLSQGASGLSQGAPGLSQGAPGLSQGAPGLSQGASGLSRNEEELDLAQCPEHDDPVEAVTGYHNRDEADICKFYRGGPEKTCYKKSRCKKKHIMIHPDGWTLDRVGVPARVRSLPLPAPGTWRRVRVTHVCHLDRLYVQYATDEPDEVVKPFGVVLPPTTLAELVRDMNSPAMRMTYKPLKLTPALGELVAALYPFDDQWYRARVHSLSRADQNIELCYIDYGNVVWVKEDAVRALEPRHWQLPAQAQRCRLAGVRARSQHSRRWAAARDRLAALALEKVFDMRVVARDYEEITVEMFDEHGASLAEQLAGAPDADVALEPYELEDDAHLTHKLVVP